MKRGDICTAAGGSPNTTKPRPVLIISDDHFSELESVTVVPFTTKPVDAPLLRVPVTASTTSGLEHDSYCMIDKVSAVKKSSIGNQIGRTTSEQMLRVERALLVYLGIAG